MPVIRLIGDDWSWNDKIVVSVLLNKKVALCLPKAKEKLGVNVNNYDIFAVEGEGKKAKILENKQIDPKKSFQDQGVKSGGGIYFRKKGARSASPTQSDKGLSPKPSKRSLKSSSPAPSSPVTPVTQAEKPPTPVQEAPAQDPSPPPPAVEAPPAPVPVEPEKEEVKPEIPPPVPPPVPAEKVEPEASVEPAPAAVELAPKPPTPTVAPEPVPSKPATPNIAPAPTPQPPVTAPAPTPPTPVVPAPTPKPPTPITAAIQPSANERVITAAALAPVAPTENAAPAIVTATATQPPAMNEQQVSGMQQQILTLQNELEEMRKKRLAEETLWQEECEKRGKETSEVESRLIKMRQEELEVAKNMKEESLRREAETKNELKKERQRFEDERKQLLGEVERVKVTDDSKKEVEQDRKHIEMERVEIRRKYLQYEIGKLEDEAKQIDKRNEASRVLDTTPEKPRALTRPTIDFTRQYSPERGPRPGESTESYKKRVEMMALQRLELEVQEEVLARDLHAAEQRREVLLKANQQQEVGWWDAGPPNGAPQARGYSSTAESTRRKQSPRAAVDEGTPGRRAISPISTPGRKWSTSDKRRREAALRRSTGGAAGASVPPVSDVQGREGSGHAENAAQQVLNIVKKQLDGERQTAQSAQEKVREALEEMRSVKQELENWRLGFSDTQPMPQAKRAHVAVVTPEKRRPPIPVHVQGLASSVPPDLREYGVEFMELVMEKTQNGSAKNSPEPLPETQEPDSPFDVTSHKSREKELNRIRREDGATSKRVMQTKDVQFAPELPVGCQIVGDSQVMMPLDVARALISTQQRQHVPQLGRQGVLASPSASPSPGRGHHSDMTHASYPVSPDRAPAHPWAGSSPSALPALGGALSDAYAGYSVPQTAPPQPVFDAYESHLVSPSKRSPDVLSAASLASPQVSPTTSPHQPVPAKEAIRQAKEVLGYYGQAHGHTGYRGY